MTNNYYYDYIGSTGSYPIIDNFSNILDNEIKITSNILENHSSNYTSNLTCNLRKELWSVNPNNDNAYLKIITQNTNSNLYINNPYNYGKIYFNTTHPLFPNSDVLTRIDYDNKLYVYFGGSLLPPKPAEWWCVEEELSKINDNNTGQDLAIIGLQSELVDVYRAMGLLSANVSQLQLYTLLDTANGVATLQINGFALAQIILLGASGLSLALASVALATASYINNNYISLNLYNQITSNNTYTQAEKEDLYETITSNNYSNSLLISTNLSNLNVLNGFINSNIVTPQLIPNINNYTFTYNGVELSTKLNDYLLKQGGTMTGRINFNYGANVGIPVAGSGGSGERINLNINGLTINDYAPSIGVSANSLWMSAPNTHSYQWYNNGTQIMNLSSAGNLVLNNPITTAERQYPPKLFNSTTNENVITFLGQSGMLSSTITLNAIGITYGSGVYELYSSSRYNASEYQKLDLFNYNTTTNEVGGHWAGGQYSSIGVYQGVAYIKPDYLGEFLVVKLPNPIVLTRFRFYPRLGFNNRIPGEFRFYGSMNGVDFTEITQASQITPRLTTNDIINGYYEKTLTAGFNTPYLYIGFTVNKLIGTTNPDSLNFQEFQMFGKEVLSSTASLAIGTSDATTYALNVAGTLNATTLKQGGQDITVISSNITLTQTPNLQKKYMFTGTCSSSMLMPDGITYFAYDIDLRNYTQLKYAPNPNTPYRIFKIKVFFGSVYFGYLTNGKPNVISYEVYMSNESQGGGGGIGSAGLNVCAINGYPENPTLNAISPTQLSLVCGDFNYVTVLSRVNGTVFNAIIEDCLF